jgi:hypothetical protein
MPYSSSTGSSGVAHLASQYGVPIICADLPDFRQMAQGEELAIEFYQAGNATDLAKTLVRFLDNPEKQHAMAAQNFAAALRMTMPNIVRKYLRHFELHQRAEALKHVSRFRRLPRWVPSKSLLLRAMTRNSLGWVRRSAVSSGQWNGQGSITSLNRNGNGSGKLHGPRAAVNGDGVGVRGNGRSRDGGYGGRSAATGNADKQQSGNGANGDSLDQFSALHVGSEGQPRQSEEK